MNSSHAESSDPCQSSLEQATEILESITDPFFAIDANWRITYANQRIQDWWHRSRESLIGLSLFKIFPDFKQYEGYQALERAMQSRAPASLETLSPSLQTWFALQAYPARDGGLSVFFQDITEKRRVEQALHESERKYRELVQYAPAAIYEIDFHTHHFTEVNDQMLAMSGYSRAELLSMDSFDLLEEDGRSLFAERIHGWLLGKQLDENVEYQVKAKDGRTLYALLKTTLLVDHLGRPKGAMVIAHDITERKRVEASLRQSQHESALLAERLKAVLENSLDAPYRRDLRTDQYDYISPSIVSILGFTVAEMQRMQTADILARMHPDDSPVIVAALEQAIAQGAAKLEYRFRCKDGVERWVGDNITITKNAAGQAIYRTGIIRDISARKQAQTFNQALNKINRTLHSSLEFQKIIDRSISAAAQALACDTAALQLRKDQHWLVVSVYGFPDDILGMQMDDTQELHAVLAIQTRQPVAVDDAFNDERFNREHLRKWGIRSVLVIPVIRKDESIGVIYFNYQTARVDFTPAHIRFATQFASSLSLALDNAQLYENMMDEAAERQRAQEELLESEARERQRANEMQALMDATPTMIWISRDPECSQIYGNDFAYQFLKMDPGENISQSTPNRLAGNLRYRMMRNGQPIPPSQLPLQLAAASGRPVLDETLDIVFDDGRLCHIIGNANPLFDEKGHIRGAVGAFMDITELRRLEAQQIKAQMDKEVHRRLTEQREQERVQIARDLHDGPIQMLSSTMFHLQMLKETFPDPLLQVELNQVGINIKDVMHELRSVLYDLRPPTLMHFGLAKVIQIYAQDFHERNPKINIELDVMDDERKPPDDKRLALFRIFQAGIDNILQHAQATSVKVTYHIQPNSFFLQIQDNGNGFKTAQDFSQLVLNGHFGLMGMKERADAIGAQFTVASTPGSGATITVFGPLA